MSELLIGHLREFSRRIEMRMDQTRVFDVAYDRTDHRHP